MAHQKDKAGLYVDTQHLFAELYQAQFELPKRDRPILVNRMLGHCEAIIGYFALAYKSEGEEKIHFVNLFIAEFEALKVICRFAIDNLIKNDNTKFRIREQIARIDEGADRWRKYIMGTRQEPHTGDAVSPNCERSTESHSDL